MTESGKNNIIKKETCYSERTSLMKRINEIVKKHGRPILTKEDVPYHATLVFNAGVA